MFGSIADAVRAALARQLAVRSARFRPIYRWFFWLLVLDCIVLGYVGVAAAGRHCRWLIGQVGTLYYFVHFLVILPLLGKIERPLPLPRSISESVLGPSAATNTVKA